MMMMQVETQRKFKACSQESPITILFNTKDTTNPWDQRGGKVTLERRLENIIGFKVVYAQITAESSSTPYRDAGFIRVLKSNVLGSLSRGNEFQTATGVDTLNTVCTADSTIIGWWAPCYSTNIEMANWSSQVSAYDVNTLHLFPTPYSIQYFDWRVEALNGSITTGTPGFNLEFAIQFFPVCECSH